MIVASGINKRKWQKRKALSPLYLLFSLFLLLLLFLVSACSSPWNQRAETPPDDIHCTQRTTDPVTLNMYYSNEKQAWIDDVVADFNNQKKTACDGLIKIVATPTSSGTSMQQIVAGTIHPDIWSPAGRIWLSLIEQAWNKKYGTSLISMAAHDTPVLALSPIVIAMWKSEAQALGWPQKQLGWSDIATISTDPHGWASYGHPEWGSFKFSHTNPQASNSGLDAVIAENYAGAGEARGLTLADVQNPKTQEFVANVESSIIAYGNDDNGATGTASIASKMFCHDPSYLSAVVMYENLVIEGNDGNVTINGRKCARPADQVVAIYPKEGTFYSDHPFVIPQAVGWMTPAKKAAAIVFRDFLLATPQQEKALHYGFRPASRALAVGAPIDAAHGANANQPEAILALPSAQVIAAAQQSWQERRRKVDVLSIVDRSGSMNAMVGGVTKLAAAQQGLAKFVSLLGDLDGFGLTTFSNRSEVNIPVSVVGTKRENMYNIINAITASGYTHLFDTIDEQWKVLKALPSRHIKVIVVLTDGLDNASALKLPQLLADIKLSGSSAGEGIRIFTIAYGSDANRDDLTQIATATGAQEYAGTPQNIQKIYTQISTAF